jgi:superoxide dismutase, Cu-Zn family
MTPTSRRVLAMPAIVAIAGFTATGPSADADDSHEGHHRQHDPHGLVVRNAGPLVDLQPATTGPFDGASAAVRITATRHGSHAVLRVRGISGAEGQTFGAHLHAGPCVAGAPAAALGHYNVDPLGRATPQTEVWLDFTVDDERGSASASVPFVPLPGTRSVVIHAEGTDPATGTAGPRQACLPVVW